LVEDVNVFVDGVERLVHDEPNVRHVVVRGIDDVPPALRYVVRLLDPQARTL